MSNLALVTTAILPLYQCVEVTSDFQRPFATIITSSRQARTKRLYLSPAQTSAIQYSELPKGDAVKGISSGVTAEHALGE